MEVQLGERVFVVGEPPLRVAMAWRKRLKDLLGPVLPQVQPLLPSLASGVAVELSEQSAAALASTVAPLLMDAPDLLIDLVFAFWPELEPHRDAILDTATDRQMMAAFGAALGVAYPFGQALAMLAPSASQPSLAPTPNGGAPQPARSTA